MTISLTVSSFGVGNGLLTLIDGKVEPQVGVIRGGKSSKAANTLIDGRRYSHESVWNQHLALCSLLYLLDRDEYHIYGNPARSFAGC